MLRGKCGGGYNCGWAGLAAAVLLAGAAGVGVQWRRAERALERVTAEQVAKDDALADAATAQAKTVEALRALTAEFVTEQLARKRTLTTADRAFLRDVQALWQAVADTRGDTTEARDMRAEGASRLGNVLDVLGSTADAEVAFRTARGLYEQLAADEPVAAYRVGLAYVRYNLGILLRWSGRLPEAETELLAARGLYKQLADDAPDNPVHRADLARTERDLAGTLAHLYRPAEAESGYQRAHEALTRLVTDAPDNPDCREALAGVHKEYGDLLNAVGRRPEAEVQYRLSLGLQERLAADFPAQPEYRLGLGDGYYMLGHYFRLGGRATDALDWFAKAVAVLTPASANEFDPALRIQALTASHRSRASACFFLGRHADAVAEWDRVLALSPPPKHPDVRAARVASLAQCGRTAEAVAEVDALTRLSDVWPANDWYNFGCVYTTAIKERPAAGAEYAPRAVAMLQRAIAGGFKDAAQLASDDSLDPLRGRADFQTLVNSLPELAPNPRPAK